MASIATLAGGAVTAGGVAVTAAGLAAPVVKGIASVLAGAIKSISPEAKDYTADIITWMAYIYSGITTSIIVGIIAFILMAVVFIVLLWRRNVQNGDPNPVWNALGYGILLAIVTNMIIISVIFLSGGSGIVVYIAAFVVSIIGGIIISVTGFSFIKDLPDGQVSGYAAFSTIFWPMLALSSITSLILGYFSFKRSKNSLREGGDLLLSLIQNGQDTSNVRREERPTSIGARRNHWRRYSS